MNLYSSLIMSLRNYPFIKWMKKTSLNNWESVDLKGIIFPPSSILYWSKDWLGQKKLALSLDT